MDNVSLGIKFKTLEVAGFHSALHAMRNPMDSWAKSDTKTGKIGPADRELSQRLSKAGDEHAEHAYVRVTKTAHGDYHTGTAGEKGHICQNYRVVIDAYHLSVSPFVCAAEGYNPQRSKDRRWQRIYKMKCFC